MNFLPARLVSFLLLVLLASNCSDPATDAAADYPRWDGQTRFEPVAPDQTGITFANTLSFDNDFNIWRYRNFYNGGGVAIGDLNNDGLSDLYLTGNRTDNKLYLNRGDFRFEDVTDAAGVAGQAAWSTGVTLADVNGDGWLDIYLCNSGNIAGDDRRNELYLNNQDDTFTEAAAAFGLANEGLSTHAVFFDYDRDGDLDCYLLNNSYQAIGSFNLERNERPKRDEKGGDILYRNDGGQFTDVSEQAGIYGSIIGFGLGITVGDVNRDGWPDLYISNDFFERDYLYVNQQDGTFAEELTSAMNSISTASMGADMADINNDGYGEIFVTEMLPATNERLKTATTFENWNKYQFNLKNDYYHQFTRNMLQRNNGDGTFSEVGRLSGVEATDWSWGALIFDFENDGNKDLFVANGIYQDLTNRDFLDFIADDEFKREVLRTGKTDYKKLVDVIPSNPVPNAAFRNLGPAGDYRFEDVAADYGLDLLGFSNGSAYGDLDNDGDLDLVVNNTNRTATVYRNHSAGEGANHWLQLVPRQEGANPFAVGTKATVFAGNDQYYLEHMPMRGFQSSMDYRLHFGLGDHERVDSVLLEWPDGSSEVLTDLVANQRLTVSPGLSRPAGGRTAAVSDPESTIKSGLAFASPATAPLFQTDESTYARLAHAENRYSDFDRDPLVFHMLSAEGPALCTGTFTRNGPTAFYRGGGRDQPGSIEPAAPAALTALLEADKLSEDVACACFDADGDGVDDLYVVSGSSEFGASSQALLDRLYLSRGGWHKSEQLLPNSKRPAVGSVAVPYDVDGDGDQDLFVGSRIRPGLYGVPADSYLLLNDGRGQFTEAAVPALADLGMITDARWTDLTGDGRAELIVVGEWLRPRAFRFRKGTLEPYALTFRAGERLPGTVAGTELDLTGWYTALETADLNGDGRADLLLGNHGLNSRFHASATEPVTMHVNDFDGNGRAEQIISLYENGTAYPVPLLHDLVKQLPPLRKKYLKYATFGDQTINDMFDPVVVARSVVYEADELRSLVLLNNGDGTFTVNALPTAAQEAPVYALLAEDVDGDGDQDVLVGGNFYYAKPEVGRYDATRGLLLRNDGSGKLTAVASAASGINVPGETRNIVALGNGRYVFGRNNLPPALVRRR